MKIARFLFWIFLFACLGEGPLMAQTADSSLIRKDTNSLVPTKKRNRGDITMTTPTDVQRVHTTDSILRKKHNPKLASWLSVVLPGAGQVYNKKWWKVPIFYAGLAASSYFIYDFGTKAKTYQTEYRNRMQGKTELLNPDFTSYSDDNVLALKQYYQRNMEFAIAATAIIYVLNIIDASVDAHLFYFDISEDLSMQMTPYIAPATTFQSGNAGMSMVFKLK